MTQSQHSPQASVLVVEDEFLIRLNAVDALEDAGFHVYAAECPDAAVRILEEHGDIGLVFTDVNMPGSMNGLDLARHVSDRWPEIRLAVTSGGAPKSAREMPTGGVFIAKPYAPSRIAAQLRSLLDAPAPMH
jgi:DNA-binding NtrC family response regulator